MRSPVSSLPLFAVFLIWFALENPEILLPGGSGDHRERRNFIRHEEQEAVLQRHAASSRGVIRVGASTAKNYRHPSFAPPACQA
jgi:hypothetical protein